MTDTNIINEFNNNYNNDNTIDSVINETNNNNNITTDNDSSDDNSDNDNMNDTDSRSDNSNNSSKSDNDDNSSNNNQLNHNDNNNNNDNIQVYSSTSGSSGSDSDNDNTTDKKKKKRSKFDKTAVSFDDKSIDAAYKKLINVVKKHHITLVNRTNKLIQDSSNNNDDNHKNNNNRHKQQLDKLNGIDFNHLTQYIWYKLVTNIYEQHKKVDLTILNSRLDGDKRLQHIYDRFIQCAIIQRSIHSIIRDRQRYLLRHYRMKKLERNRRYYENKKKRKIEQIAAEKDDNNNSDNSDNDNINSDNNKHKTDKKKQQQTQQTKSKILTLAEKAFSLLKVGYTVDGIVEGINNDIGCIYVDFWYRKNKYRGMIHISQLCDKYIDKNDIESYTSVGDAVRCVIYSIDQHKMRVSLSLKKSNFPEGKEPIIERLSQTVKSNDNDDNNNDKHVDSSSFINNLQRSIKSSLPIDKINKLMQISKGRSTSGNRLGQRERRKLIADVYGENAKFLMDIKKDKKHRNHDDDSSKEPKIRYRNSNDSSKNNSEQHNTTTQQDNNNNDNTTDTKDVLHNNTTNNKVNENIHPSWAAKKQIQGIVAPTGKKVKLS